MALEISESWSKNELVAFTAFWHAWHAWKFSMWTLCHSFLKQARAMWLVFFSNSPATTLSTNLSPVFSWYFLDVNRYSYLNFSEISQLSGQPCCFLVLSTSLGSMDWVTHLHITNFERREPSVGSPIICSWLRCIQGLSTHWYEYDSNIQHAQASESPAPARLCETDDVNKLVIPCALHGSDQVCKTAMELLLSPP